MSSDSSPIFDLLGPQLLSSDGEVQTADVLEGKQFLGLYFAGVSWDEPSRTFTPRLSKWYRANADELDLEAEAYRILLPLGNINHP